MQISPPEREPLLDFARFQLRNRGLDAEAAEDLVQDAYVEWCAASAVSDPAAWLRGCIRNMVRALIRQERGERPADPLEVGHLSLDEPWARGGS